VRRLTAIIFTDIAGFTALSGQNESRAFNVLERQRELVFPLVEQYAGQCLKEIGDGLLLSFPSSLEAVKCALEIQKVTASEPDLRLRIGIHQGDVIEHKGDLLGDGVNTAARLEPLAPVGGIVMSQRVFEDISSYPEYETVSMGIPPLKGVEKKIAVYCLVNDGLPTPTQFWLTPEFEPGAQVGSYKLSSKIGSGSRGRGQIWISRTATGQRVALKIVKRQDMDDEKQFDREFKGICHYEPVSRTHDGLIDILHVSRDDEAGYYYYAMELADDAREDNNVPEFYKPKNMASQLESRGRLPARECLSVGIQVAKALGCLHANNIVHRDVRPEIIVYCHKRIKLADISLVTSIGESFSASGTQGYAPVEGPGYPAADVYSLGKVIYELMTGLHRRRFPELPPMPVDITPEEELLYNSMIEVLHIACDPHSDKRYSDGNQFAESLMQLDDDVDNESTRVIAEPSTEEKAAVIVDPVDPAHENPPVNNYVRIVTSYKGKEVIRDLPVGEISVGRVTASHSVDVDLNPDTSVSRLHARIWFHENTACIEDAGSSYGTKVNGHAITSPHTVVSTDFIEIGETTLTIHQWS